MWQELDDSEKQKYKDEAERLKLLHAAQYPDYKYQPKMRRAKFVTHRRSVESVNRQPPGATAFNERLDSFLRASSASSSKEDSSKNNNRRKNVPIPNQFEAQNAGLFAREFIKQLTPTGKSNI
jgi:hypothetical protein